ncbi:TetR/AcrR family transcriptional regulator [Streptomyces sp. NBC_01476]|uniref:TetR/AcrR family transcriptional regulator n=1 Tax=Streptomyces sp. NBC_01476 TaxID=2903881 RepID=UPI002E3129B8|nr:TetR/AcrR family transcriptional regulator [Streptomyces sp. NBC_01476]
MAPHDTQPRPMRRDAVRNHQLVMEAARAVLAEFGTDASMELIASRAGVGVGTVYRRFPNKEALVDEIATQILSELADEAQQALERGDGTGLEVFLWAVGRSMTVHHGYADKLVGHTKAGCVEQLRDLIVELLSQAQEFGKIGPDVTLGDIMTLVWGLRGVVETGSGVVPDAWQRHLDIHLAGLRSARLPSSLPSVSREQLTRVTAGTGR